MCGIAGFVDYSCKTSPDEGVDVVMSMSRALRHRGPDDSGFWCDASSGVFLAHQRLSIIDLSSAGHQPMISSSGRYVIIFNGEIYNYLQIRIALGKDARAWVGDSDTEVVLSAIERWGPDLALQKFEGMFAFALWDREKSTLTLARDRFGEKPLYWAKFGSLLIFASELKSLQNHPKFIRRIDRAALTQYMNYGFIAGSQSIYQGVEKLSPGALCSFGKDESISFGQYWSTPEVAFSSMREGFKGGAIDAANKLESLLSESVRQQLLADVPVGAFLSGGVDSTTIVALAQTHSSGPIKTFTIGFDEKGYNEAPYAADVAKYLGTDHTECYLTREDVLKVLPHLPALYDEPFADPSQIPTFLVCKLAKANVTVSLSGDGGDELFCGYNRYAMVSKIRRFSNSFSLPFIRFLIASLSKISASEMSNLSPILGRLGLDLTRQPLLGSRLHKFACAIRDAENETLLYEAMLRQGEKVYSLVLNARPSQCLTSSKGWSSELDLSHRMMLLDTMTYLTDDILVKVDRASMGVSLETRMPFLNHKLFEFSWSLPLEMKVKNGRGKWLLRQVLYKHVPQSLIERQKAGFSVPIGIWLRGGLKEWAEDLLDANRLSREGFLNVALTQRMWKEHQQGSHKYEQILWRILMFQAWLDKSR